jgi:HPt (histidine-containing phosphotransfer) domain-containing protein
VAFHLVTELLPGVHSLGERFLQRAVLEIQTLHSLLERARADGSQMLLRVARVAHSIHGTGAAFGFEAVSECAGALERRLKLHLASEPAGGGSAELLDELHVLVARLDVSITQALVRVRGPLA